MTRRPSRHRGSAWLALCAALALHVAEEATTGFLDLYNPTVEAIRRRIPYLPIPTFEYAIWLGLLVVAIIGLTAVTPFAYKGTGWTRPLSYLFAAVMLLNGLGHLSASSFLGELVPGTVSSPLLIAASIYLIWALRTVEGTGVAT